MREHIAADEPFVREDVPASEALDRFLREAQDYKVELIEDLVEHDGVPTVSLYTNGPFTDLCRGPHAPSTKRIKAFKLQSVAGAYWRGDSNKPMLTRDLRDRVLLAEGSRRLPRAPRAGPRATTIAGSALSSGCSTSPTSPPGWRSGFPPAPRCSTRSSRSAARWADPAATPRSRPRSCTTAQLWKTSGHWDKYREHMFLTESSDTPMGLKPMNCPGHCQLYSMQPHSYRDLPIRYSEPGLLHRNEPSGDAPRAAARAQLRPGRRTHLLRRGAGPGRGRGVPGLRVRHLRDLRLRRPPRALDASGGADRFRRAVGPRRGSA